MLSHHSLPLNRSTLTGHTEVSGQAVLPRLWCHIAALRSCWQTAGQPWGSQMPLAHSLEVRVSSCMEFSIVSDTMCPLWPWS